LGECENTIQVIEMSYDSDITEQILSRYNWLKTKGDFPRLDTNGERTSEYHNLTHLDTELSMCERVLLKNDGKEKFLEMRAFVDETFRRLDQ